MVRKYLGCLVALGTSLVLAIGSSNSSTLAADVASTSVTNRYSELLDQAKQFERDRRWQEAIQQYEKLNRKFPQMPEVEQRLQVSRIRFDVTRRYSDKSFLETVDRTSPTAALDLLGEVLTKLQVYYVEAIDLSKLLRNGTAFLEVALTEDDFLRQNVGQNVRPDVVDNFRVSIHKFVLGRPATSLNDVRTIVSETATRARDQIGIPPSAVIFEYISGFVGLLDPYSAYLTAGEYQEIMSQIEGNLIGLGVELWAEGNELHIVEVFPAGPAAEAGLTKGDRLLEIGGVSVSSVGAKRAADLLRGPEGSMVKLIFDRPTVGQFQSVVRRRRVEVPSVSAANIVDSSNGIGYLRISNFQKTTAREVDEALKTLYGQGLKSLIIDLRRNPGGLLDSAVEIADRFLFNGRIVTTRGRNRQEDHEYMAQTPGTWELPLLVMIDEDSASASEIFAGAIRDQKRGLIVGRTSYGKGSVQGVFHNELSEGGMRLTVSKFFSPAGYAISARGIIPHISFDDPIPSSIDRFVGKIPVSTGGLRETGLANQPATASSNVVAPSGHLVSTSNDDVDLQRAIQAAITELPKIASLR
ncbi:MAG: S41 family peptidase [Pirellulaceae bacterium]|nr:S41 family peptidase [Pirellulaceae bacterium]